MNKCERTRKLLIMHYQAYPKLQIQDIFKFLYQSAFGCEHFVASVDVATGFISKSVQPARNEKTSIWMSFFVFCVE